MLKLFYSISLVWLSFVWASEAVSATEIEFGVAPVYWQYEESSDQRSGFPSTPLSSKANGWGLGVNASVQQAWVNHEAWSVKIDVSSILPLQRSNERWQLGAGTTVQQNKLDIRQAEGRVSFIRQFNAFAVGAWGSYQWHEQSRRQFVVNGVVTPLVGEPIKETVQTAWVGLAIQSHSDDGLAQARIEAGLPAWVHTTNDLVSGAFNRRSGFRVGVDGSVMLPWQFGKANSRLTAAYRYRELGNDLKAAALWPKNRWQTMSLGAALTW